jgi:hypothetical protein
VGRISSRSTNAGRVDDLEQQGRGHRHGACRGGGGHAIFWREYFGHLLANFEGRRWHGATMPVRLGAVRAA